MPLAEVPNKNVLSMFSLAGKVAAVTGGARGIGLEVCRGLAEAGASVALLYTTSAKAPELAKSLAEETGQRVSAYQVDVRDETALTKCLEDVFKDFGNRLDIVVANAGIALEREALAYTPEEYRNMMAVNLDGVFFTAQAAGRIFKRQGSGNLIFTGSVSAQLVNKPQRQAAYNASKAGVVHLAKCLAVEWVDFARVNCISPGFIATDMLDTMPKEYGEQWSEMTPGKRFCNPYELKGAYVFAASDASSYMTGADLIIDAGYTLT